MSVAQKNKIPILTYHSIDESGSVISTGVQTFREQMKFLSENNFNVVSLKTLAKSLFGDEKLLPKTTVLTFDDGFENFYTTAFPILNEYNFPATVFLITDYCGKINDWSGNLPLLKPSKLMDWSEIRELNDNNIEFASHTRTHPDLTKLSGAEIGRELAESKQAIEERLGAEVFCLAYPYGKFSPAVKQIAAEYFKSACSTNLGKVALTDDLLALKRLDAYYLQQDYIFRCVLSGQFDWYVNFRQAMRAAKAAYYRK